MAISLFPHNQEAYESVVKMLAEVGKAAVIHPTGTGKSFIGFKLCEDNPDKKICWLSPSEYIFKTQLENLSAISDGWQPENIAFFTYAKLAFMTDEEIENIKPDYIILDEFHRCGAEVWGSNVLKFLEKNKGAFLLGLSATNIRYLDNQRDMAEELFDNNIASQMTLGTAIVRGILNPPKYVLSIYSYNEDLKKYEKKVKNAKSKAVRDAGEKYLEALRRALEKAEGLDIIFDRHMEERTGKYIIFCADYEHMQDIISTKIYDWFHLLDKNPEVYTLYSGDYNSEKSFQQFKENKDDSHLRLLFCIDALNEGVHIADISGVILLRPTVSPIIYKQQIGRALSASGGKNPVIFDIVNNIENLYSIDSVQEEMQVAINYYRSLNENDFIVNEKFEILDKVADCKALFDELENVLTASWDLMFQEAENYYLENGHLNVPRREISPNGYSLGQWLETQRGVYKGRISGVLDEVQIEKLNSIGMRWENLNDISWRKHYEACERYFAENGNLLIPAQYKTVDNINLGAWISCIRTYRKNGNHRKYLSDERIEMLDKLGMKWDVFDYLWEKNFQAVAEYHRVHGNIDIPVNYVNPNGLKIGVWLSNIRKNKSNNLLTDLQISRLEELGINWYTKYEKQWFECYEDAKNYYNEHGNLDVPVAYVAESGRLLGRWIRRQRDKYKKGLSEEKIKLLDEIGMIWEIPDSWEEKFLLAKQFFLENGHLKVPANYIVNGIWLHKWLSEQKLIGEGKRKKQLTSAQRQKLESIGMEFGKRYINFNKWYESYEKAKEFYLKNGHLEPKKDEKVLFNWVKKQKRQYHKSELTNEKIKLLEEIGIIW